ncbi:hypothetical protein KAM385_37530 [Aeromonas hydrophila]|nr:hypothetical protein KAM385_37530 [Aeromonas hydrophila]
MLQGYIGGDFNDFVDLAILADREVGCFQPNFLAVLADSLEGTLLTVAIGQLPPEFPIGGGVRVLFSTEDGMVLPL